MSTLDAPLPAHEFARRSVEDDWFAALDGSVIPIGAASVAIQVLGIHRHGDELWIQLAPFHASDRGIVLHCWPTQSLDQVLAALRLHLHSDKLRQYFTNDAPTAQTSEPAPQISGVFDRRAGELRLLARQDT